MAKDTGHEDDVSLRHIVDGILKNDAHAGTQLQWPGPGADKPRLEQRFIWWRVVEQG